MKTGIGASLPEDLFVEFNSRSVGFPGGKSGLIKESLRLYFSEHPLSTPKEPEVIITPQEQI